MNWRLSRNDLLFLVDTFMPDSQDRERAADLIRSDEGLSRAMLDDERLFHRLLSDEGILFSISPWLFFGVLLHGVQRDLKRETFTVERRSQQHVVLFDADRVSKLLEHRQVRDYLVAMLASFTRIESVTIPVRVRKGIWRRYRANDLDVESLIHRAESLNEESRYELYRRIADICLFLAGMFPDYLEAQYRYPLSGGLRPRARSRLLRSREDYEQHGRAFYRLAAEHEKARSEGLEDALANLSADFVLAEKPLSYLADHYLRFSKYRLFDLEG